jgi:ribosomal protein S18 acetylase RimI-like enzyme
VPRWRAMMAPPGGAHWAARGASGVAVSTPERNGAAVALYRRAGFAVVGRFTTLRRPVA